MMLPALLHQWNEVSVAEKNGLRQLIVDQINRLIETDFNGLVRLLYSVDVSEEKLKTALQQNAATNAAELITDLLLARLSEKAASRNTPLFPPPQPGDAEAW